MPTSIFTFTHPISRPYPYWWFKWVVLIGGIVFTAFFTALSLAANGYVTTQILTRDYNGTVSVKRWTSSFPFNLLDHVDTSCQSLEIPISTRFWTDKLTLAYILTDVWQVKENTLVHNPSLSYTNNTLEDCSITYINVLMERLDIAGTQLIENTDSNRYAYPPGTGNLPWSPKVTAHVICTIKNNVNPTFVRLSVDYASIVRAGAMKNFPKEPNSLNETSLWWGKSLLSWYWSDLASTGGKTGIATGSINLVPTDTSITNSSLFMINGYWFQTHDSSKTYTGAGGTLYNNMTTYGGPNMSSAIAVQVDHLAKAMYATVLADLGVSAAAKNNVLFQPDLLESLSKPIDDLSLDIKGRGSAWISAGPANASFSASSPQGTLSNQTPSYIYTDYVCQIPTLKSGGALFVSVLIADLVLLQAMWMLLNWTTTTYLETTDPSANVCQGCLERKHQNRDSTGSRSALVGSNSVLSPEIEGEGGFPLRPLVSRVRLLPGKPGDGEDRGGYVAL